MKTDSPVVIRRSEYRPSDFLVDAIALEFDLEPQRTRVLARLTVRLNPDRATQDASTRSDRPRLVLNGENLELVDLKIDGQSLAKSDYRLKGDELLLSSDLETFVLQTEVFVAPEENTSLNGLYTSNGNFFTQCEAQGFRRITWFPDRPDIMSRFTVRLNAPKEQFPVLLSNGNLVASGQCAERPGWHWADWEDPFPKPSYLFALVAGKLTCAEKTVHTASGKERLLQVWVEPGNEDKTDHAMQSLIRAMRWDEERYGLELDLDRFMIVAVSDFNMGAMENKGLNIFNTKYVFANPRIATDTDFANVESVVGHEYFHNWTGNRVTCRDWFQLTLKEGLTVFRDQEFSADVMASEASNEQGKISARVVKRIDDVRVLRIAQFAEDAGPMAHAIRPDSYSEISNFYTVTIYQKGAEVIRMLQTLVGEKGFRQGMDLYFERHDGQAVTCDDFISAIADANSRDFSQFSHWYSQAGTPVVQVRGQYDHVRRRYVMTVNQICPPTPGQTRKKPFHIPLAIALLNEQGHEIPLVLSETDGNKSDAIAASGETVQYPSKRILELTEASQEFVFEDVATMPVPSLLRSFSAPVILDYPYTETELSFLAVHETDPFNRWDAIQRLAVGATIKLLDGNEEAQSCEFVRDAVAGILRDSSLDPAFRALALSLPGEGYISEQLSLVDPVAVRESRNAVQRYLVHELQPSLEAVFNENHSNTAYKADAASAGKRALKNVALSMLVAGSVEKYQEAAFQTVSGSDNMTDQAAALSALVNSDAPQREQALALFAEQFADEALVMDKWFSLQATMHRQVDDPPVLDRVLALTRHPDFSLTNPNRIRSLVSAFCSGNLAEFHAEDGKGYAFWLDQVLRIDATNPQVASRLARAMDRWRKFDLPRQARMKQALNALAATDNLSRDVAEIVHKALAE